MATKHFLTGEELSRTELLGLIQLAEDLKVSRAQGRPAGSKPSPLLNQTLALVFEKPSLRTRMSFTVAMQELGGSTVESVSANVKHEEPEDVARVLSGYVQAVMLRTHDQSLLERMASHSKATIINGLSDLHHPCQALADLQTLRQKFGEIQGIKLAYIGDGNNVLHSLALLAPFVGVELRYACPKGYEPSSFIVKKAKARAKEGGGSITAFKTPEDAVKGANAIYTDVWTSMGFEKQKAERERAFAGYQLNRKLFKLAAPGAIALHCLPMVRGLEITDEIADDPEVSALFQQSENRLHAQKALLLTLLGGRA